MPDLRRTVLPRWPVCVCANQCHWHGWKPGFCRSGGQCSCPQVPAGAGLLDCSHPRVPTGTGLLCCSHPAICSCGSTIFAHQDKLLTSCSSPRAAGHLPGLRLVRLGRVEILGHSLDGPSPRLGRHVVTWWPTAGALALVASQAKGKGGWQGRCSALDCPLNPLC